MNFLFRIGYNNKRNFFFFFILYFITYLGLGAYFVSLSPYILQKFKENSQYIFLSSQITYPLGYFLAGWISDKTKRLKIYGILFSLFLFPTQFLLFDPKQSFWIAFICSGLIRFLFAALIQILQIAALEKIHFYGFSVSRSSGTFGFLIIQILMFFMESFVLDQKQSLDVITSRGGQISSWIHILTFILCFFILPKKRNSESRYYFKEVLEIIKKENLSIFFILSFFYYMAYQIVDFYLGRYFQTIGSMKFVYLSWIIAVLLEIPFFYHSQKLIHRFGLKTLFLVSLFFGFLRFFLMFLNHIYFHSQLIILTQIFHGIHFTGYMAGSVYFFHKKFPEQYFGTSFGLFIVFSLSFGSILGNLLYGEILKLFSYDIGFGILFFLSFVIHLLLFLIKIINKKIDFLFL